MRWDNRTPCASCPYRKDVPTGTWHVSEFENLLANDADPVAGGVFGCHKWRHRPKDERRLCIGWLLDQQRRGMPSIQLRLLGMRHQRDDEAMALFDEANDGGFDLYETLQAMCAANGVTDAAPIADREQDT